MRLVGAYSNLEIQDRLRRLAEKLDRLAASDAVPRPSARQDRILRPGLVLRAVGRVLAEAPGPMRVRDIHAAVEDLLGSTVAISSVNSCLSTNVKGDRPRFVRLGYGKYLLLEQGSQ